MSYRVLGFSTAHDSSVCVICDGELEFFAKEERYTGEKRDKQPFSAIDRAIAAAKGPINTVVMQSPTHHPAYLDVYRCYICKKLNLDPDQDFIDLTAAHHISHLFNAYNNSGFGKALVFVIDRDGSQIYDPDDEPVAVDPATGLPTAEWIGRETESVYAIQQPCLYKELYKAFWMRNPTNPRTHANRPKGYYDFCKKLQAKYPGCELSLKSSFGITKTYESGTTLIGEGPMENGKTMGLAAYGEPKDFPPLFIGSTPIDQYLTHESWCVTVANPKAKMTGKVTPENHKPYADWAYHLQRQTQQALNHMVQRWVKKTGLKDVIITGGYGLNVVANNYLIANNPDVNFYFEPNADDTGNSLGAAWYIYRKATNDATPHPMLDTFYHHLDPQPEVGGKGATAQEIAQLIADGRSVALYDGNPEAGPRALGHRSILFDARQKDAKDRLNLIKKREWYRPFAGIILEEYFQDYFETLGVTSSPNMTISFDAKEKALQEIPGVIHVDGTCRMQTVTTGFMSEVLREYNKITGVPVLMNTSFNLAGKPLVHTKQDALDTLQDSMLDYVYFVDEDTLANEYKCLSSES